MGRRVTTVAGIAGFGSLLAGVGGPKVIEGLPSWVNVALFASGAILLVAAFVSHLLSRKRDGDGGTNQTTHGPYSPNFSGPVRDVHIHSAPAERQERKRPRGWWERSRPGKSDKQLKDEYGKLNAGLEQVIGTMLQRPKKPPMEIHPDAILEVEGRPVPQPDMPLNGLLVRLYKKQGPVPNDAAQLARFRRSVDREIANEVKLKKMRVWGHLGRRPIQLISQREWDAGEFYHMRGTFSVVSGYPDPTTTTYFDLYFNKDEVDRVWPLTSPEESQ